MKTGLPRLSPAFVLILLISIPIIGISQSKKVSIGTGSGYLSYPNAQTTLNLQDGDTLAINAGTYIGLELGNIVASNGKKIYLINNGLVSFENSLVGWTLTNLVNVEIKGNGSAGITHGFKIRNMSRAITSGGLLSGTYFSYIRIENIGDFGIIIRNDDLVYNGSNNSLMYDVKFLNISAYNIGGIFLLVGEDSHISETGMRSMMRKLEIANCDIDRVDNGEVIKLNKVVDVDLHHNRITQTGLFETRNTGCIFLRGEGDIHHNYINGLWGNGVSAQGFGLDEIGGINIYNNIILNSRKYSAFETASFVEDIDASPFTKYCDYRIYNNTIGNMNQSDWQSAMVDTYNSYEGIISIRNNIGFNIESGKPFDPNKNYIYSKYAATIPDTANNLYKAAYIDLGLVNDVNCMLNANSPVIDRGENFDWIVDDFEAVPRPQNGIFDLGAREFLMVVVDPTTPIALAGRDTSVTFPGGIAQLDGSASYARGGASISTYRWTQVSGPTTAVIANNSSAQTSINELKPGDYIFELKVIDNNGEQSTDRVSVNVFSSLRSDQDFSIYPNPATKWVRVRIISDTMGPVELKIYDANGAVVMKETMLKSQVIFEQEFKMFQLSPGMYFVEAIVDRKGCYWENCESELEVN